MSKSELRVVKNATKETVEFHYIKSNYFRVVHADGVYGGATPKAMIAMNFFSERLPIAQRVVYGVSEDGVLGNEVESERVGKTGVVREVEVEVLIDVPNAEALISWLQTRIKELSSAKAPGGSK